MEFIVRRYKPGDEIKICEVIKKDILTENINDYNEKDIEHLIDEQNDDLIRERAKHFHAYTFLDKDKIVGIGRINSLDYDQREAAIRNYHNRLDAYLSMYPEYAEKEEVQARHR